MSIIKRNSFFDKEELIANLKIARMDIYYKDFVKNSLKVSLMMAVMLGTLFFFFFFFIAKDTNQPSVMLLFLPSFAIAFYALFKFFLKMPEIKIIRSRKNIDAEIISAIRFLILDLKANAPIYDALQNLSKNFDEIGRYLKDINTKVKLGLSLEDSLDEAVELVPSEHLRILFWQLINYLQTGADITQSLSTVAHEIVEKQKIDFKKYGKKLNVLSLFYMIIAIILPTIGFTMITAALIFIGFQISLTLILGFWVIFTVFQLMFLVLSGGNRPVTET